MGKEKSNKVKLLKLWDMLSSDSDENNPLSTNEILSRLKAEGILCDRRTFYGDIKTLNGYGYEVMCELKNHSNHYYVSERGFDTPELKILMDAVTAANFISSRKTVQLHNKIAALAGCNKAELLKKSGDADNLIKVENESVYYTVNELDEAIMGKNKVTFQYFDFNIAGEKVCRKNGERYLVNPLATVFSGDRYYLVAFRDDRDRLNHYRIDRMQNVKVEEQTISKPAWLEEVNLAEHKKQAFSMYSGDTVHATFEVDNSLIDVIFDKFGTKSKLIDTGNNHFMFSADIQVSPVFFGWCLSFEDKLKIISPKTLVTQIKTHLQSIINQY